jgi:hypothetical protein
VKDMAKNTKLTNNQPEEKKHYKMPFETWWGKILIWTLFVGMVGGVLLSFIVAIISGQA